jgi:hypothetical protein
VKKPRLRILLVADVDFLENEVVSPRLDGKARF